jgi:hypothetical protein
MLIVLPDDDAACLFCLFLLLYGDSKKYTILTAGLLHSISQRDEKLNSSRNDAAARTFLLHTAFVLCTSCPTTQSVSCAHQPGGAVARAFYPSPRCAS